MMTMGSPDKYAWQVRARPYGPREITAGAMTLWFHGPYVVMTLTTPDGDTVSLSGCDDDDSLAADLAEILMITVGDAAQLADPGRLRLEHPATRTGGPTAVAVLRVDRQVGGCRLTLRAGDTARHVDMDGPDVAVHAAALRAWSDAMTVTRAPARATGIGASRSQTG